VAPIEGFPEEPPRKPAPITAHVAVQVDAQVELMEAMRDSTAEGGDDETNGDREMAPTASAEPAAAAPKRARRRKRKKKKAKKSTPEESGEHEMMWDEKDGDGELPKVDDFDDETTSFDDEAADLGTSAGSVADRSSAGTLTASMAVTMVRKRTTKKRHRKKLKPRKIILDSDDEDEEPQEVTWSHEAAVLTTYMENQVLRKKVAEFPEKFSRSHPECIKVEVFILFARELISDSEAIPHFVEWFESPLATRYLVNHYDRDMRNVRKVRDLVRHTIADLPKRGPERRPSIKSAASMAQAFTDYLERRSSDRASRPAEVRLGGVRLRMTTVMPNYKIPPMLPMWSDDGRESELPPPRKAGSSNSWFFDFAFPVDLDAGRTVHANLAGQVLVKVSKLVGRCTGPDRLREVRIKEKMIDGRRSLELRFMGSDEKYPMLQPWIFFNDTEEVVFFGRKHVQLVDRRRDMSQWIADRNGTILPGARAFRVVMFGDAPLLYVYSIHAFTGASNTTRWPQPGEALTPEALFLPECIAATDTFMLTKYANLSQHVNKTTSVNRTESEDDDLPSLPSLAEEVDPLGGMLDPDDDDDLVYAV